MTLLDYLPRYMLHKHVERGIDVYSLYSIDERSTHYHELRLKYFKYDTNPHCSAAKLLTEFIDLVEDNVEFIKLSESNYKYLKEIADQHEWSDLIEKFEYLFYLDDVQNRRNLRY